MNNKKNNNHFRLALLHHYEWCEKEGRDTSWYFKYLKEEHEDYIRNKKELQQ